MIGILAQAPQGWFKMLQRVKLLLKLRGHVQDHKGTYSQIYTSRRLSFIFWLLLRELVSTVRQYCSYYCCSSPVCIHSDLLANPPLKMSPRKERTRERERERLGLNSAVLQTECVNFRIHLCCRVPLGPYVCLVIFVMSEPDLCRRNKWLYTLTCGDNWSEK